MEPVMMGWETRVPVEENGRKKGGGGGIREKIQRRGMVSSSILTHMLFKAL